MNVLVTGGSGFIGSHFVDALRARGDEVTVFDCAPPKHTPDVAFIKGDIRDGEAVGRAVRGCEVVIHAGGMLGTHETVEHATETTTTNVVGSLNVMDAATKAGAKLVNISKPNVWLNPYSITKDAVENFCFMYVNEFDAEVAVVKLYNVYGTRQKYSKVRKAIPTWIVDALNGKPIEIFGSGTATVDLVHTRDVSAGVLKIIDNFERCRIHATGRVADDVYGNFRAYSEQVLELGRGEDLTVNDTVAALSRQLPAGVEIRHLPMRRGEVDGTILRADITRLSQLTGFKPRVDLDTGLRETVAYYQDRLEDAALGVL